MPNTQKLSEKIITRRGFLISATTSLVFAPAVVRTENLMACRGFIVPVQHNHFGFVDRLRIDFLYRSGQLQGAPLKNAIDQGLLNHISSIAIRKDRVVGWA
jgi:hypothetical protein